MHTHGHTWARSHTLCSLGFKLTLLLPWGAVRWGTNRRPQRSAQAEAMWYVETVGSVGTSLLHTTSSSFIPEKTERGRNWQLTMKSWQSISPWWCQLWDGHTVLLWVGVCFCVCMRKSKHAHGQPCEWFFRPSYLESFCFDHWRSLLFSLCFCLY